MAGGEVPAWLKRPCCPFRDSWYIFCFLTGAFELAATAYRQQLRERYENEAQTLAPLTGGNIGEIRKQMNIATLPVDNEKKWYQRLWNN